MTGLPFFPALREDELLYGAIARYHHEAGWASWSATLEALFGRRHVVASHDLPGHIGVLCDRLQAGGARETSAERLIDRATLLPYLASAVPPDRRMAARVAAVEGGGTSHLSLGLAVSRVPRLRALRFCPTCRAGDLAQSSGSRWRRAHQLPGTLVCGVHHLPLRETPTSFADLGRHEYLLPDGRSCPASARPLAPDDPAVLDILAAIARRESEVLQTGDVDVLGPDLPSRFADAGLMRSRTRIDQVALAERAISFFSPVAGLMPWALSDEALGTWPRELARGRGRAAHPLLHVLMAVFLDAQPGPSKLEAGPFGRGPWPCVNPLADHVGSEVIRDVRIYVTKGRTVGRFECVCGYVYSRSLDEDGSARPPRYVRYGPLLGSELRGLAAARVPLRGIGRTLGIHPATVAAEADRLGIATGWIARTRRRRRPDSSGRRAARAHDRRSRRGTAPRRDWRSLDGRTLSDLREAAARLLAIEPPVRLTRASLERAAGMKVGWTRRRSERLPRTASFLRASTEAVDAFRERRAASAISCADGEIAPWRIMRSAGLSKTDLPMIERLVRKREDSGVI